MSGAPTTALISVAGNQIHGIALRGPAAEVDDGSHTVTFELEARDSRVARIVAQHWLGEASRKSGLPIEQARVIWVAPGCRSRAVGHRFIEMARTLVEDEETVDLAAVAAQIHLELHVKALITSAVVDDVSPLRRVLIEDDGDTWRPHHSMARALLKALFSVEPATEYARGQEYQDHVKRRNAITHRSQTVSLDDGAGLIAVVDDLWLWLTAAGRGADRL